MSYGGYGGGHGSSYGGGYGGGSGKIIFIYFKKNYQSLISF